MDGLQFMAACRLGRKNIVNILINRRKIDLHAKDKSGRTGFMLAFSNGHKDIVQLLLECSEAEDIDISTEHEELSDEMKVFINMFGSKQQKM